MAEKILALIVAFLGGVATMSLLGTKLINLALRYSARARALVRDELNRLEAEYGRSHTDPMMDEAVQARLNESWKNRQVVSDLKCAFGRSIPCTSLCERFGTVVHVDDKYGTYMVCEEHARMITDDDVL